jgi:integrase
LEQGDTPSSINRTTKLLGQSYELAIRRKLLNDRRYIRQLSEKGNERQGLCSEPEFQRVVEGLPEDLRNFARFGYLTGMRKGEIVSLLREDFEGDVLKLRGENSRNGEPRLLPLVGEVAEILERRKAAQPVEVNGTLELSPLIFHENGQPIDVRKFWETWNTACVRAGIGKYVGRILHDLSRSAVRNMVKAGIAPQIAKRISGHKTDSMFERYSIINMDDLREALAKTQQYRKTIPTCPQKVVAMGSR